MNGLIKILIVEDDKDWQKGIVSILKKEKDILIVGVVSNENDAINQIRDQEVDIILMDISLNSKLEQGIYLTSEVTEISNAKIIMLTSFDDNEIIIKSFTAGACNYILKSNIKSLANTIRETYSRITPVEVLAKKHANLQKEVYLKDLSPSERDLYNLYEKGFKLSEIEEITKKSNSTLRNQVRNILSKLGAKNLKQAQKKDQLLK